MRSAFSVDGALNWGATGGTLRVATVTRDRGAVVAFLDIDLATVSTVDELITEIETLTGVTMGQDAEGRLIVTVAQTPGQPGLGIAFRPLDENAATVGDMLGLNNLFVGSEGQRLEDPHTQAGAALHITVNPRIARDPAQIAHALLSDAPDLASGDTGLQVADWRNLADVYQEMGQAWEFKATQGLAEQRTTPFDYLRLFISHAAEEAFTAKGVLEVSRLTYTSWEKSLQEAQGVDMNMNNAQKMMWSEYMRNVMHLMGMTLRLNSELLQILRSL